jgi:hypothetical protein
MPNDHRQGGIFTLHTENVQLRPLTLASAVARAGFRVRMQTRAVYHPFPHLIQDRSYR